jgi:hypothetical protein
MLANAGQSIPTKYVSFFAAKLAVFVKIIGVSKRIISVTQLENAPGRPDFE